MGWCNVRRFISIVMFRLLLTLGTWHCFWHSRVEIAIESIASHSDVFHLLRAKGRGWVLLVSRQYFEFSLRIFHTQLCHNLSFTHNCHTSFFVTHHLSHTTLSHTTLHTQLVLLFNPPPPPLSFLPSPSPLHFVAAHYRKKLTCGVIRSFNFCLFPHTMTSTSFWTPDTPSTETFIILYLYPARERGMHNWSDLNICIELENAMQFRTKLWDQNSSWTVYSAESMLAPTALPDDEHDILCHHLPEGVRSQGCGTHGFRIHHGQVDMFQ